MGLYDELILEQMRQRMRPMMGSSVQETNVPPDLMGMLMMQMFMDDPKVPGAGEPGMLPEYPLPNVNFGGTAPLAPAGVAPAITPMGVPAPDMGMASNQGGSLQDLLQQLIGSFQALQPRSYDTSRDMPHGMYQEMYSPGPQAVPPLEKMPPESRTPMEPVAPIGQTPLDFWEIIERFSKFNRSGVPLSHQF